MSPLPNANLDATADADLAALRAQSANIDRTSTDGCYLQILGSASIPADEVAETIDSSVSPSDRVSPDDAGVTLPASSTIRTSIDEYQSPAGPGYLIRQEVMIAGDHWMRYLHEAGDETGRAMDWAIVG